MLDRVPKCHTVVSSIIRTGSYFKNVEFSTDTLKNCVFIATTVRSLHNVKAVYVCQLFETSIIVQKKEKVVFVKFPLGPISKSKTLKAYK